MLSLVLIRTIGRGSNAESQKKHRQRLNQTAVALGQKLRWQERQQLLCQKILSMDTKSETYTNLSCSLYFTFYGILFPKLGLAVVLAMLKEGENSLTDGCYYSHL